MRLPVLMYHAIDESRSVISIQPQAFEWQMGWLHEKEFQIISLSQAVRVLRNGTSLPPRTAVITFDDGFEGLYQHAFPILERYGYPATVFLVAGHAGRMNDWPDQPANIPPLPLLTWAQIWEMDRCGIEFGSHTMTHPRLDQLTPEVMEHEIFASKAMIEDNLGHSIDLFAFPYGRYNELAKSITGCFYSGACSTRLDFVTEESDPLELERVDTFYLKEPFFFRGLAAPLLPLYLSQRRMLRSVASTFLKRQW